MTPEDFQQAAQQCTHFVSGHYPRNIKERLLDIAESPYSDIPVDRYGSGGFITTLEEELAELFGKEAAVFMPSGTMAQPIALRVWADQANNQTVAFHPKCHLECHEQMAYRELHHLNSVLLGEADRLFTIDDLKAMEERPATLLIELPQRDLGGELPTWEQLQEITNYAKSKSMKLHLDGARLWESQPFYQRTYQEIAKDFDSLYVSFYKVLQGLPGAALVGPADFIAESRIWLRRQGGNLSTMAPNAISAKIGMERHLPKMAEYVTKAKEISHALHQINGIDVRPGTVQTNMMHLHFAAPHQVVIESLTQIAIDEKCLLVPFLVAEESTCWTEMMIGMAALDISTERIRTLYQRLSTLIQTKP